MQDGRMSGGTDMDTKRVVDFRYCGLFLVLRFSFLKRNCYFY